MTGCQLRPFEKLFFHIYFLIQDISLNISLKHLKFGVQNDSTHIQGTKSLLFMP